MASGSGSAQSTVARMEGTPANDELGGAPRKKVRTEVDLELDIFYNPALRAYAGWKNIPQPWIAETAMKYVNFTHFDRLWPESSHVAHCKAKDAKYSHIEDLEVKWRFLTILRGISNEERWPKNAIRKCVASLMYAKHVLRVRVDWSTLKSVNKKIGQIGDALAMKKPTNIPYEPIPDWFRQNPKLVDEPGCPLPPDRTPKRPRWRCAPQNPIDIVLREVFEAMEMDVEGNDDGQNNVSAHEGVGSNEVQHEVPIEADGGIGVDGVPEEVVTRADERAHGSLHGSDEALAIAQRTLQEKTTEYLADVEAYRARISHLETLLAGFEIRLDRSSSSAPLVEAEEIDRAPPTVHVSMQAEKDAAVEQATAANLNALELSTANQELQRQFEVLRQNPFEAENQALRRDMEGLQHQIRDANERLADYTSIRENMQKLQEENAKLKEYFHTMLKECKGMRTSTLLAIARARQYELEFEGIQ